MGGCGSRSAIVDQAVGLGRGSDGLDGEEFVLQLMEHHHCRQTEEDGTTRGPGEGQAGQFVRPQATRLVKPLPPAMTFSSSKENGKE